MNTTLRLKRIQTIRVNYTALINLLAKLVARLRRHPRPADDPAALRYIASKYYKEID